MQRLCPRSRVFVLLFAVFCLGLPKYSCLIYQLKDGHKGILEMSASTSWIGTSWKMNKTLAGAMKFAAAMRDADADSDPRIQRFVIPPFTMVRQVKEVLANTSVRVGVQNMHWADQGAWTGEVSPLMVKDCGADIVELGHSERREHFGETNDTVGLKTKAAVRYGMIPLSALAKRGTNAMPDVPAKFRKHRCVPLWGS